MVEIRRLDSNEIASRAHDLGSVLLDCVAGGASVSFMAGLTADEAKQFFLNAADKARTGHRVLLAAFKDGSIVGTVQLLLEMPPNQPHRAEISKLLVSRAARGQGIGRVLMIEAEQVAIELGKSLLMLDTASRAAERIYDGLGWQRLGVVPDFALNPDGTYCDTTYFYKQL